MDLGAWTFTWTVLHHSCAVNSLCTHNVNCSQRSGRTSHRIGYKYWLKSRDLHWTLGIASAQRRPGAFGKSNVVVQLFTRNREFFTFSFLECSLPSPAYRPEHRIPNPLTALPLTRESKRKQKKQVSSPSQMHVHKCTVIIFYLSDTAVFIGVNEQLCIHGFQWQTGHSAPKFGQGAVTRLECSKQ